MNFNSESLETDVQCMSRYWNMLFERNQYYINSLSEHFQSVDEINTPDPDTGFFLFKTECPSKNILLHSYVDHEEDNYVYEFLVYRKIDKSSISFAITFDYNSITRSVTPCFNILIEGAHGAPIIYCSNISVFLEQYNKYGTFQNIDFNIQLDSKMIIDSFAEQINLHEIKKVMFPEGSDGLADKILSFFEKHCTLKPAKQ